MAIVTSFEICQKSGCSTLVFKDTTGAYSATNIYGYNSPNESITSATATLTVTLADLTSYTFALTNFPTIDKTLEFNITGSQLGYSTGVIPDQIIKFTYTVITALSTIITQIKSQAFYCNASCCVKSMFIDLDLDCEDCLKSLGDRSTKAYLMLKGLEYSASCGDATTFNKTLTQINKLCANSACQSCK